MMATSSTESLLEEKRRTMLMKRSQSGQDDAESMRSAIFEGRPIPLQQEPPNPSSTHAAEDFADPQRLFQLLRRKKKTPHSLVAPANNVPPPLPIAPPQTPQEPVPPPGHGSNSARGLPQRQQDMSPSRDGPTRPVFSARPFSPADRPPTNAGSREVHSAQPNGGLNGRPFTRQKHPKKSLDLFPTSASASQPQDLFPRPNPLRRLSGGSTTKHCQQAPPAPQVSSSDKQSEGSNTTTTNNNNNKGGGGTHQKGVNFNCLFFKSEDELDGKHEVFPPQGHSKAPANIPLIETDWFSADTWEQLPTTDGAPQQHDEDLGPDSEEHAGAVYAESLYELLVASKRRPLAR